MYVVTQGGDSVSVIATATNAQIEGTPIPGLGPDPFGIAYDPVHQQMYVTTNEFGGTTVSRINTTSTPPALIPGPITVGPRPLTLAYDPETGHQRMYVTNLGSNTVSVIDTTQNPPVQIDTNGIVGDGITPITVGNGPWGVAYDPDHQRMYVTNFDDDTVSVIDTDSNTVVAGPITVGDGPTDITYDPVNNRMYVTNFSGGTVSVIFTNTNMVIKTITDPSFALPVFVTFDPINRDMYVTNQGSSVPGKVSVIDTTTNTVINTIDVGNNPIGIAYDPVNKRMYVGNSFGSNSVSVINLCPA